MNKLSHSETPETDLDYARYLWTKANKGLITKIADELGYSQPFVSDVFYKKRNSTGGIVEARLTELGAPGFTKPTTETDNHAS